MSKCAKKTGGGGAKSVVGCTSTDGVVALAPPPTSLFPEQIPSTKPFMWWLGAKTKLIPHIARNLPHAIADIYEPFCGSAAVSLAIAPRVRGQIHLSDLRWDVIGIMNLLREGRENALIKLMQTHEDMHCAGHFAEVLFGVNECFAVAEKAASIDWLADYLYLNQTCFGARLTFGTDGSGYKCTYAPGRMADKFICREKRIMRAATILQAKASPSLVQDFRAIQPKRGDLVYCDPPYEGKNVYGNGIGNRKDYTLAPELAQEAKAWRQAGARVMVSLNDSESVRKAFDDGWRVMPLKKQYLIDNRHGVQKRYSAEVLLLSW